MSDEPRRRAEWDGSADEPERLDDAIAEYIDRLNAGEKVTPDEVLFDHPTHGPEIVAHLEAFVAAGQPANSEPAARPLGMLGDYTLRRQLGRGGMGVVYEAWEGSMDRRVALKVLPAGAAADDRTFHRFLQEAKTAGKLSHPNVVPVYGVGVRQETPYYAMELVEGETLAAIAARLRGLDRGAATPFGPKDDVRCFANLAEAFAGAADGLQHAHSKGVVHRDVKPSNLILDREGRLRILDFGLAHLEGQEPLTRSGDVLGTPQYMSPEQARRKQVKVDHRTDVYSLGATLYELLTGQPPFRGRDHLDTLTQIIERDPVTLRRRNDEVPADLETIVLKCLRKDPADRYGTAEALAQDLRRFVRRDAIEARPEGRWERAARRLRRHRVRIVGATLVLAAVASLGWQALLWRQESRLRVERQYEEQVLSAALRLELASLIQKSRAGDQPFWGLGPGSSGKLARPPRLDPVEGALASLEECRALIPLRPEAPYHRSRALLLLGRDEEAEAGLAALGSASHPFVPAVTLRADLLWVRGAREAAAALVADAGLHASEDWEKAWLAIWGHWRADRFPQLVESYTRLIDLVAGGREPFPGCALLARLGRGEAALATGDITQALQDFGTAESLAPGAALPALLAGKAWLSIGRKDEAERVFLRLHGRTDQKDEVAAAVWGIYVFRWEDQERALSWAGRISVSSAREARRARTLHNLGQSARAEDAGRKALEDDPGDADVYENLAFIWIQVGKQAEARALLKRGLSLYPDSSLLHHLLGWSYSRDPGRDVEKAIAHLEGSLALPDAIGAHGISLAILAQCHSWKGDVARADEARRKAEEVGSSDANVQNFLAITLTTSGRLLEAIEGYDRAIALWDSVSWYPANKGLALRYLGRFDEALVCLRKSQGLLPWSLSSHLSAGAILEIQGKASDALEEYAGGLRVDPASRDLQASAVALLERAGSSLPPDALDRAVEALESAREAARKAAGDEPGGGTRDPWPSISLALALSARGRPADWKRAVEVLLEAFEAAEGSGSPSARLRAALRDALRAASRSAPGAGPLSLLPSLPPYGAIDAAMDAALDAVGNTAIGTARDAGPALAETGPSLPDLGNLPERLRSPGDGSAARNRRQYLEARLLAAGNRIAEAIEKLEELSRLDAASPEPVLRLAEALRLTGAPDRAAAALRAAVEGSLREDRSLWDLWLALEFVDLRRSPAEVLALLPPEPAVGASEGGRSDGHGEDGGSTPGDRADAKQQGGYGADVRWLLERLAAGEPLRIRCGGGEYREPGGTVWGKDRFARGGRTAMPWGGDVRGTDTDPLYQTERWFPLEEAGEPSAYAIPLPPGKYGLHLHFAEVARNVAGVRRFDVLLGGRKVIEDFDPMEAGFATAIERVFDAEVRDGLLEVRLVHRPPYDSPKVSAIEVERVE